MTIRRHLFARLYRDPNPDEGGGGFTETSTVDAVATAEITQDNPGTGDATATAEKPASAHEAMWGKQSTDPLPGETPEATAARLRDDQGRFAKKPEVVDPLNPTAPAKKPDAKPEDALAMPEGLSPKAQTRFQELANTNKELTGKLEAATAIAGGNPDAVVPMLESARALQTTFQEHGIRKEQFEQGMQVIGMMNRGDLAGAQQVLEEQLRLISLATGKPIGAVDALAKFPDLREAVDALQITEANALEVARARTQQGFQQQTQQRQQQEQQYQQQEERAVQGGQIAVDKFCKARMSTDLDYAKIEPILLREIKGGLLQGVPPSAWASLVEKTYNLIKQTGGINRSQASAGGGVLRPSGGDAVQQAPKNAFEAMWGKAASA